MKATALFFRGAAAAALIAVGLLAAPATQAGDAATHPATEIVATSKSFGALVKSVNAAVKANGMFVVTRASASVGAARRDIEIPGNMVVGVYRNDFAVRMLEASVPAGIEAPIRFYLTENADGSATLSYRTPSDLFSPYGSAALDAMAAELDTIFAKIATDAVK